MAAEEQKEEESAKEDVKRCRGGEKERTDLELIGLDGR